jgi:hypothetical protein
MPNASSIHYLFLLRRSRIYALRKKEAKDAQEEEKKMERWQQEKIDLKKSFFQRETRSCSIV